MTQLFSDLSRTIDDSIDIAAQRVAAERDIATDEVYRRRVCRFMSAEILSYLMDNGIEVKPESRAPYLIDEHRYVVINPGNPDRELIVDATWQQFLPEGTDTSRLPRALIGTRDEVIAQAESAGVAQTDLRIWLPANSDTLPRHLLPHELVAQAIDSQPQ